MILFDLFLIWAVLNFFYTLSTKYRIKTRIIRMNLFLLKLFILSLVVSIIILMSSNGGGYTIFQITSFLLPYLEGMEEKQYLWKP